MRADVVAGGFRLREARPAAEDRVVLATCGAMVPEVLAAADALAEDEGVEATVLCLSSPDRLYREWQRGRTAPASRRRRARRSHLERLVAASERELPVVTVIDGVEPRALLARLAPSGRAACPSASTASARPAVAAGGLRRVRHRPGAIVTAALVALEP